MIKKLIYKLDRPEPLLLAAYDMRKVDIILFAYRSLLIAALLLILLSVQFYLLAAFLFPRPEACILRSH